jgi:hypothetical protein
VPRVRRRQRRAVDAGQAVIPFAMQLAAIPVLKPAPAWDERGLLGAGMSCCLVHRVHQPAGATRARTVSADASHHLRRASPSDRRAPAARSRPR